MLRLMVSVYICIYRVARFRVTQGKYKHRHTGDLRYQYVNYCTDNTPYHTISYHKNVEVQLALKSFRCCCNGDTVTVRPSRLVVSARHCHLLPSMSDTRTTKAARKGSTRDSIQGQHASAQGLSPYFCNIAMMSCAYRLCTAVVGCTLSQYTYWSGLSHLRTQYTQTRTHTHTHTQYPVFLTPTRRLPQPVTHVRTRTTRRMCTRYTH